jgi:hypothetical protein
MAKPSVAQAYVQIVPTTDGISKSLNKEFAPAGEEAGKSFSGSFNGVMKAAIVIGGAVLATKAVFDFGKASVLAAEELRTSEARLSQINQSMGLFGGETDTVTKRLRDYAKENELLLATDENVIMATQAKLLTFRELALSADTAGGAFDRATAASIDLAAAGFGSAETNAVQLGKALNDPIQGVSALRRVGLTFTDSELDKIRVLQESGDLLGAQEIVLAAIETQVQGTALATANASDQMKLAFGNIKEEVGTALMPAFAELTQAMLPIAAELAPLMAEAFGLLTPVLTDIAKQLPALLQSLFPLIPLFADIALLVVEIALELMPVFVEIINVLVEVLQELLPVFLDFLRQAIMPLIPLVVDLIRQFAPLISRVLPVLTTLLLALIPPLIEILTQLFIPLIPIVEKLIMAFLPLLDEILPILIGLLEFVIPILLVIADIFAIVMVAAVQFLTEAIGDFSDFFGNFADNFNKTIEGVGDFFKGIINGMIGMFENFVNFIIGGVNGLIKALNRISFEIPATAFTPAFRFGLSLPELSQISIPRLAKGGYVDQATLAMVGEAGPEVVTPLKDFERMMNLGEGDGKTLNYYAAPNQSIDSEQALFQAMRRARVVAQW